MTVTARFTDSSAQVLQWAGSFLAARPVEHNLMLTLLHARRARPNPARYSVLQEADDTVGVVFQTKQADAAN